MRSIYTLVALPLLLLLQLPRLGQIHAAPHQLHPRGTGISPSRSASPSKSPPSPKHLNLDLSLRPPGSASSAAAHAAQQPKDKHARPVAHHTDTNTNSHLNAKNPHKRKWGNVAGSTGPQVAHPIGPSSVHTQPHAHAQQRPAAVHPAEYFTHMNLKAAPKKKWWKVAGSAKASMGRPIRRPDDQGHYKGRGGGGRPPGRPHGPGHAQPQRPAVHGAEYFNHMNLKAAPKKKWWNEPGATKPTRGPHTWRPDNQRAKKLMMQRQGQGQGPHDLSQHPDGHNKGKGGGGRPGSPGGAAGTHAVG